MYHSFTKDQKLIKNINAETNTHHSSQQTTNFPVSPAANQRKALTVDWRAPRSMDGYVTRTRPLVIEPPMSDENVISKANVDFVGNGNLDNEASLFTSGTWVYVRITDET